MFPHVHIFIDVHGRLCEFDKFKQQQKLQEGPREFEQLKKLKRLCLIKLKKKRKLWNKYHAFNCINILINCVNILTFRQIYPYHVHFAQATLFSQIAIIYTHNNLSSGMTIIPKLPWKIICKYDCVLKISNCTKLHNR